jgi:hypothetical protein
MDEPFDVEHYRSLPPEVMQLEGDLYPNEDEEARARRIFRQALPIAAAQIVHLSTNATNEATRYKAATYVVERVLGKPGEDPSHAPGGLLAELVEGFERQLKAETERF